MKRIIEMNLRLLKVKAVEPVRQHQQQTKREKMSRTPLEALGQRKARNWKKHRKSGRQVMKNSRKSIVICMVKT